MREGMRSGRISLFSLSALGLTLCVGLSIARAQGQEPFFLTADQVALSALDDLLLRSKDAALSSDLLTQFRRTLGDPEIRWKLETQVLAQFNTLTPTQRAAVSHLFFGVAKEEPVLWEIRRAAHSGARPEFDPDPYLEAVTRRVLAKTGPQTLKADDRTLVEALKKISGTRRYWMARAILESTALTPEQFLELNRLLLGAETTPIPFLWSQQPASQPPRPVPRRPEISTPEPVAPAVVEPAHPGRELLMEILELEVDPANRVGNPTYVAQRKVELLGAKLRESLAAYHGKLESADVQRVELALARTRNVENSKDLSTLAAARAQLEQVAVEHLRSVVGLLGRREYSRLESSALEHGELTQKQGSVLGQVFLGDPSTSADLWVNRGMFLEMVRNTKEMAEQNWGMLQVEPTGLGVLADDLYHLSDEEFVLFEAMLASDYVSLYREAGSSTGPGSAASSEDLLLESKSLLAVADALSPSGAIDAKHEASRPARAAATGVFAGTVTLLSLQLVEAVSSRVVSRIDSVRAKAGCAQALAQGVVAEHGRAERLVRWMANRGRGGAAPPKKVTLTRRLGAWALEQGGKWSIFMGVGALGGYGAAHAYEWGWDPKVRGSTFEALLLIRAMLATELVVEVSKAEIAAGRQNPSLSDSDREGLLKSLNVLDQQLAQLGAFVRDPSRGRPDFEAEHVRFVKEKAAEVLKRQRISPPEGGLQLDPSQEVLARRLRDLRAKLSKK